jgi:hypothetical protein
MWSSCLSVCDVADQSMLQSAACEHMYLFTLHSAVVCLPALRGDDPSGSNGEGLTSVAIHGRFMRDEAAHVTLYTVLLCDWKHSSCAVSTAARSCVVI